MLALFQVWEWGSHSTILFWEKGKLGESWGNYVIDVNQTPRIITLDINIEEKNANIDNVNSWHVKSNKVNGTDRSHQGKGLIHRTDKIHKEREWSYCHLERYCHVFRAPRRGRQV